MLIEPIKTGCRSKKTTFIMIVIQKGRVMLEAGGNANEKRGKTRVTDFSFALEWLRGWLQFSKAIKERIKAKAMQSKITSDTQLKLRQDKSSIKLFYCFDLQLLMVIGNLMIFTDDHITVIGFFLATYREYFTT